MQHVSFLINCFKVCERSQFLLWPHCRRHCPQTTRASEHEVMSTVCGPWSVPCIHACMHNSEQKSRHEPVLYGAISHRQVHRWHCGGRLTVKPLGVESPVISLLRFTKRKWQNFQRALRGKHSSDSSSGALLQTAKTKVPARKRS